MLMTVEQKKTVPQQIGLLDDLQGQTLQTRFEGFCERAREALTQTNEHGEPVFEAGKFVSKFTLQVTVARMADDALVFTFGHEIAEKHPRIPGRVKTSHYVRNVGLAQRVTDKQMPMFAPDHGQPQPSEPEDIVDDA